VSAISDPTLPGRGWEIFVGVVSLVAGIVMLASPIESLEILTMVVGIWLIIIGVFEIASAFGIRNASKALSKPTEKPETPEATTGATAPAPAE
jgi:uncharacterized membrane protein HdeD (DUF308 family)